MEAVMKQFAEHILEVLVLRRELDLLLLENVCLLILRGSTIDKPLLMP
jgi:hypothetical protein